MTTATLAENKTTIRGKYLTFRLAAEGYAVSVNDVLEIVRDQRITPVPCMPAHIRGVVNLRGKVVPVYDLREKLNLKQAEESKKVCMIVSHVIFADRGPTTAALVVDSVEAVIELADCPYEETPDLGTSIHREWTEGIVDIDGHSFTLLNLTRLLEDERSSS